MAFYQKYRSKTFAEMVGQEHVVATLLQAVKSGKLVHAYLLTGPRGIGKTSTARLLAKAVNCQTIAKAVADGKPTDGEPCNECESCREIADGRSLDVIEIDAASHTGVADVRELIDQARLLPAKANKKVYIIDEVHMLSKNAFNALLKTLEEPPEHVVFIMATTEAHKIPATILSRAQRFNFKRASKEDIALNVTRVAKEEKIAIEEGAVDLIATAAAGGHRDALSLLEKVASKGQSISVEMARETLGIAEEKEVLDFARAIFNSHPEEGLKIAHTLYESGHDIPEFNRLFVEFLRRLLLVKVLGEKGLPFDETAGRLMAMQEIASKISIADIMRITAVFLEAGTLLKDVFYPLLPIEIAVVKAASHESCNLNHESLEKGEEPKKIVISTPREARVEKSQENSLQPDNSAMKQSSNGTSTPVPVLEMTKDIWASVIDGTKKDNNSLAALLRDAHPAGMTDDTLIVEVKFKFHKDRMSEAKNSQLLEKVVAEVLGKPCRLSFKLAEKKIVKADNLEAGELEKAVGEVFDI